MAASSYYKTSLPDNSKPATYANPIPLRPINYSYNELPPQEPSAEYSSQTAPPQQSYEQQSYLANPQKSRTRSKWSRYIRIISLISSVISTVFSGFMNGIMVYVLIKFYTTKNDPGAGRSTPWAASPVLWPTWMLLLASGVTFVVTVFALSAACCAKSKAEGGRGKKIWFTVLKYAVHVIVWLAVAALYKIQQRDRDLWGWSCGNEAAEIQYAFNTKLNFSFLCNIQTSSSYFSIAEVVVKVIFALGHFFAYRKKEKHAGWKLAGNLVGIGAGQINP